MDGGLPPATLAFQRAAELHGRGELAEAAAGYRDALSHDPGLVEAHHNLGAIFFAQRNYARAVEECEAALRIDPRCPAAHSTLAASFSALRRYDEAGAHHAAALEIDPRNASALNNAGDWLNAVGRHDEAADKLLTALQLRPAHPDALCNLGTAYWGLGRHDEAIAAFRDAIAQNSHLWVARKNLAMALLHVGRFAEGWAEYDWRFLADGVHLRPLTTPVWHGGSTGGEVLICAEQGLGDQIMHASMVRDLVARNLRIVWEVEPRLVALFQRSFPEIRVIARAAPGAPHTDAGSGVVTQYPSGSLGRLLRTEQSKFPTAPYLKADPARVAEMVHRLDLAPGEKLVGLSWRSDNKDIGAQKSAGFADFAASLAMPGTRFVSLQYGRDESGLALDGLDLTNDLDGVAALTVLCDAVVTVSNTTAHLAGALGVPVWVLTGAGRGQLWAWGNGDKTPWYASARVIRQACGEPWNVPLHTASIQLNEFLKEA